MQDQTNIEQPTSRALVIVGRTEPTRVAHEGRRPEAPFLAQIIASQRRLPAYRVARRAEPCVATRAYSEPLSVGALAALDRTV
ncbi:MAG: hypothetical protein JO048_07475 [Methylobacteriaceae bacterium]|nr:hypothetical protein [Methylobacteriaceae bacterium]